MSFTLVRTVPYPDRQATLVEYRHDQTGLRHVHLQDAFAELNFALSVPTPPEDDTGMPHILEHMTLSGSVKYPVSDPFMAMARRSVAHQMNAHTSPLSTTYHFATTLPEDFNNLSDVYLDLVFNPLLRRSDFEQEGWRLEKTPNGPQIKGVVLNEMKGAFADINDAIYSVLYQKVAPNTPLAYCYGGLPPAIPALSYEQLVDFHQRTYVPSRAVLVTSGDIDLQALHQRLDTTVAAVCPPLPQVIPQPPDPISATWSWPEQNLGNIAQVTVTGSSTDQPSLIIAFQGPAPVGGDQELYGELMSYALFNSPSSPLVLLGKEHGVNISVSRLDTSVLCTTGQDTLVVQVEPVDESNADQWRQRITQAMNDAAQRPISAAEWKGLVQSMQKKVGMAAENSPHNTCINIGTTLLLGRDPLLDANNLAWLKQYMSQPPSVATTTQWWASLSPTTAFVCKPDPKLLASWDREEQKTLETLVLNNHPQAQPPQAQPVPEDALPILDVASVHYPSPPQSPPKTTPATTNTAAHTHLERPGLSASVGVEYDIGELLNTMDDDTLLDMTMLSLIGSSLGSKDWPNNQQVIKEQERGISFNWSWSVQNTTNHASSVITLSASGLNEVMDQAAQSVLERAAGLPACDEAYWKGTFAQWQNILASNQDDLRERLVGHIVHAPRSTKDAHEQRKIHVLLNNGANWLAQAQANPRLIHQRWSVLMQNILNSPRHVFSAGQGQAAQAGQRVAASLPGSRPWNDPCVFTPVQTTLPTASSKLTPVPASVSVNHCYRSFPAPDLLDHDVPALRLALKLVEPALHTRVREQGGAYGVFASLGYRSTVLSSYRDPNVTSTYEHFDALPSLIDDVLSTSDDAKLNEAKLMLFKADMRPQSVSQHMQQSFSRQRMGFSSDHHQTMFDKIKSATWHDIAKIKHWLTPSSSSLMDAALVSDQGPYAQPDPLQDEQSHPTPMPAP